VRRITNRTKTIVGGVLGIALLGFSLYLNIVHEKELSKFGRYTVGTTIRFTLSRYGRDVEYEFAVNGKKYKAFTSYGYEAEVPGGRYLVKFSSRDPEINEIYLNKPVAFYILPPKEGWTRKQLTK